MRRTTIAETQRHGGHSADGAQPNSFNAQPQAPAVFRVDLRPTPAGAFGWALNETRAPRAKRNDPKGAVS
jgi:hypothetical protein